MDTGIGEHRVEGGGVLAGSVSDKEAEVLGLMAKIGHEVAGLLGGPASVGVLVVPRMWT